MHLVSHLTFAGARKRSFNLISPVLNALDMSSNTKTSFAFSTTGKRRKSQRWRLKSTVRCPTAILYLLRFVQLVPANKGAAAH